MYDIANILIDLKSSINKINEGNELINLQLIALDERVTKLEPEPDPDTKTKKEDN